MLLKWIFTVLALTWLFRMVRHALMAPPEQPRPPFQPPPPPREPEGTVQVQRRKDDDDADFIDYEEIK